MRVFGLNCSLKFSCVLQKNTQSPPLKIVAKPTQILVIDERRAKRHGSGWLGGEGKKNVNAGEGLYDVVYGKVVYQLENKILT